MKCVMRFELDGFPVEVGEGREALGPSLSLALGSLDECLHSAVDFLDPKGSLLAIAEYEQAGRALLHGAACARSAVREFERMSGEVDVPPKVVH